MLWNIEFINNSNNVLIGSANHLRHFVIRRLNSSKTIEMILLPKKRVFSESNSWKTKGERAVANHQKSVRKIVRRRSSAL